MGQSVALSIDGNVALCGLYTTTGGVLVFIRSGGIWTQQGAALLGSGASGGGDLGFSVAISSTTDAPYTAITGGVHDASYVGAAWVFAVPVLTVVAPAAADGNSAFNITVNAEDTAGAFVTGYDDLLHFTSTGWRPAKHSAERRHPVDLLCLQPKYGFHPNWRGLHGYVPVGIGGRIAQRVIQSV